MRPGDLNLKGIAEMAPPANYTEVRRFLGMTGFFRRFIKNYARIAKPLNNILEGEASKLKSEAVTLPPDALEAFETLKNVLHDYTSVGFCRPMPCIRRTSPVYPTASTY